MFECQHATVASPDISFCEGYLPSRNIALSQLSFQLSACIWHSSRTSHHFNLSPLPVSYIQHLHLNQHTLHDHNCNNHYYGHLFTVSECACQNNHHHYVTIINHFHNRLILGHLSNKKLTASEFTIIISINMIIAITSLIFLTSSQDIDSQQASQVPSQGRGCLVPQNEVALAGRAVVLAAKIVPLISQLFAINCFGCKNYSLICKNCIHHPFEFKN